MTDHRAQVEQLLADYRRSREQLAQTQRDLAAITETARSREGGVEVVVGPQGVLRNLVLRDDVYQRLRPSDLAATILRLSTEAGTAAAARAAEVLMPILPEGTDPAAIFDGRADLDPSPARNVGPVSHVRVDDTDEDEFFDDGSWLEDSTAKRTHR